LRLPDLPIEVVAWRLSATGPDVLRGSQSMTAPERGAGKGEREIHAARDRERVKVYDRQSLAAGQTLPGPVIIEERETTIFVMGGWTAHVAEDGCITARKES
jgi:N-methylhydantoinase A